MHKDTHPFILCISFLGNAEMVGKRIDESAAEMTVTGMDHHASLLIQYKHVVILIYDIQRDILRKYLQSTTLVRHHKLDDISGTDNIIGLYYLLIDPDIFGLYPQLYAMTGSIFHVRRKILVHTHRLLTGRNVEPVMFEHLLLLIFVSYIIKFLIVTHLQAFLSLQGCVRHPS